MTWMAWKCPMETTTLQQNWDLSLQVLLQWVFHFFSCAPDWESSEHTIYTIYWFLAGFLCPLSVIMFSSAQTLHHLRKVKNLKLVVRHRSKGDRSSALGAKGPSLKTRWRMWIYFYIFKFCKRIEMIKRSTIGANL